MTLNDIWRPFQPMLSFPRPISGKLYTIRPQKLKLLIRNHTIAFRWHDCQWPWWYINIIRLFHIKILVNVAWYGKSYYRLYSLLRGNQQEAQLLLGDRSTRKPAKDCWNGRGNDNLGWNDLQMYFKVIKSGINRKVVYDFLLILYSNFCRNSLMTIRQGHRPHHAKAVVWPYVGLCLCKMFGRQWTKEAKIAIFNDYTLIWRPLPSSREPQRISA